MKNIDSNCSFSAPLAAAVLMVVAPALSAQMPAMPMGQQSAGHVQHVEHSGHTNVRSGKEGNGSKPPATAGAPAAAVPFGVVADGSAPGGAAAPLPATQTPLRLGPEVQEQENAAHRSGTAEPAISDALADVRGRAPQPLSTFTEQALRLNPALREAAAQVRRSQAEARQAGLWDNPEIGYEADHIRGGVYHSGEQGGYLQQVVPVTGQRSAARAAGLQRAHEAEAMLESQKRQVVAAVEQAFYNALALQAEAALRQDLLRIASDAAETAHQLANVGQAETPDVLGSEVEREQARMDLAAAQHAYRKAFSRLAAASGDALQPITPLQGDLAAVPVLDRSAAVSSADGSATLRVAERAMAADEAAVRSARRQMLPQLTVHAGLQQDNEPLEVAQGRVGVVGVAQAGLTLPLWNRNQGGVAASQAAVEEARAGVERTRLQLRAEASAAMEDYLNAAVQIRQYREELLPRAERAQQLYRQKYDAMAAPYSQALLAERMLLQLRLGCVRAQLSAWQSAVALQTGVFGLGMQGPPLPAAP